MSQVPAYAGCPWPIDTGCIDGAAWDTLDADLQEYAVALASNALHSLSARQVGGCPITVRPCLDLRCARPWGTSWRADWMRPGMVDGQWVNFCGCTSACGHPARQSLELPAPVGPVDSIKVDGVEQTLSDFRIDDGNILVYQGSGDFTFPTTQDLRLPDSEPGTWSVTYLNAYAPDLLAARAAAIMAWEFALACQDDDSLGECRLPSNVRAITRTGITMELNAGLWPDGFTGIEAVDAWISTVNPHKRKGPVLVYSPDLPPPHIQGRTL